MEPDTAVRVGGRRRLTAGAVLTVLGALLWGLAIWRDQHEAAAYSPDPLPPPAYVTVTAGRTYAISTVGGYDALTKIMQPSSLRCTMTPRGGAAVELPFLADPDDKATHRVGSVVSPLSAQVHVACARVGAVYVDDADGTVDTAGVLRLLAVVLLTVGVPLTMSGLAARGRTAALPGVPGRQAPFEQA